MPTEVVPHEVLFAVPATNLERSETCVFIGEAIELALFIEQVAFVVIGGFATGFHHAFIHHAFEQLEVVFRHERFNIDNTARARHVAVVVVHHRCKQKELAAFEIEFPQEVACVTQERFQLCFGFV